MITRSIVAIALCLGVPVALSAQVPAGGEFRVNTYTTQTQRWAAVAHDRSGNFAVVWASYRQDGSALGVFGQRFNAAGAKVGPEFQANTYTTGGQRDPVVGFAPSGDFVVVWASPQPNSAYNIFGQRFTAAGNRAGAEFLVSTYTLGYRREPAIAADERGFVVVWRENQRDGSGLGVAGQRFDWSGGRIGAEFIANTYTTGHQSTGKVGSDAGGRFVVVWSSRQDGSYEGVFGQRFDATGAKLGAEFQVNTYTPLFQFAGGIDVNPDGSFVVAWMSAQDGSGTSVMARRFDAAGNAQGAEFVVNAYTTGNQLDPAVGTDALGNFVVTWRGPDASGPGIDLFGRRFTAAGAPRGAEFRVNTYTTGNQMNNYIGSLGSDDVGNFTVVWTTGNGSYEDVQGQRFGGLRPQALRIDTPGNGVLEPGETADLRPAWRNANGAAQTFSGGLSGITGPAGGVYTIGDAAADYGTVADGASQECTDCYEVSVAGARPLLPQHWDVSAVEAITPDIQGQRKRWALHVGDSFSDVPRASGFYRFVETLLHHAVTGGCGGTAYCPGNPATRDQMAVFVLVAREGAAYQPPACTTPMFGDVPASSPFCRWIEELARRQVVAGCGGGNYCPGDAVTRAQMAVFVLRTLDPVLDPPACTAGAEMFADVPASSPFCRWVEELARRQIVAGCGGGNYCPANPVTREQMSVFISATFGLTLYGP